MRKIVANRSIYRMLLTRVRKLHFGSMIRPLADISETIFGNQWISTLPPHTHARSHALYERWENTQRNRLQMELGIWQVVTGSGGISSTLICPRKRSAKSQVLATASVEQDVSAGRHVYLKAISHILVEIEKLWGNSDFINTQALFPALLGNTWSHVLVRIIRATC